MSYRRLFRHQLGPLLLLFLIFLLLKLFWTLGPAPTAAPHPHRDEQGAQWPAGSSLFIAAVFWNGAPVLPAWTAAVLQLAADLGPEHVFVSIYESGSWDESKHILTQFDAHLTAAAIPHRILLDHATHVDAILAARPPSGCVRTPQHKWELRRIPFLAEARNHALQPLQQISRPRYTHILFLNDVYFTPKDVYALMTTNNGSFAAACALDFRDPPYFYDTFALRDSRGQRHLQHSFPYFRASASRDALLAGKPVPVRSCWNGMALMDATPFHSRNLSFRSIPDSMSQHRLEASECCLIHIDNPLSPVLGVYVHPQVRVAYSAAAYEEVSQHGWPHDEASMSWREMWASWWPVDLSTWDVRSRIAVWRTEDSSHLEPGEDCIIREMQVLRPNGWAHV